MSIRKLERDNQKLRGKVTQLRNDLKGHQDRAIHLDKKLMSARITNKRIQDQLTIIVGLENTFRILILTAFDFESSIIYTKNGVIPILDVMAIPADHHILRIKGD